MGQAACVREGEEEEEATAWFGRRRPLTQVVWQRRAKDDLAAAVEWLDDQSESAADRLITAVEEAVALLQAQPGLGRALELGRALQRAPALPAAAGVRAWAPRGFPSWLLLYRATPTRPTPTGIVILRLVHAARDLPFLLADGSLGPSPFFQ